MPFSTLMMEAGHTAPAAYSTMRSAAGGGDSGTRTSTQPWHSDFREKVSALSSLKAGWAGRGSVPVEHHIFYAVENYLGIALAGTANPVLPYLVPTADGGLQIEWHRDSLDLEVLFTSEGQIQALVEDRERGLEIEKEGDAALDILLRYAPRAAQERSDVADVSVAPLSAAYELAA